MRSSPANTAMMTHPAGAAAAGVSFATTAAQGFLGGGVVFVLILVGLLIPAASGVPV